MVGGDVFPSASGGPCTFVAAVIFHKALPQRCPSAEAVILHYAPAEAVIQRFSAAKALIWTWLQPQLFTTAAAVDAACKDCVKMCHPPALLAQAIEAAAWLLSPAGFRCATVGLGHQFCLGLNLVAFIHWV